MNIKFFFLLLAAAIVALPVSAQKLGGSSTSGIYKVPPDPDRIQIHPYLSLKIGYDSNVLLDESGNEQDDILAKRGLAFPSAGPLVPCPWAPMRP